MGMLLNCLNALQKLIVCFLLQLIWSAEELYEMNSRQLDLICGSYDQVIKPYFRGVFSSDAYELYHSEILIPNKLNIYIVNSAPSSTRGEHWLLICKGNKSLFFDSFGKPPSFYNLGNFEHVNTVRLQGKSKICGLYCILLAKQIAQGKHMTSFIHEKFSPTLLEVNDTQVIDWFQRQPYGYLLRKDCYTNNCLSYDQLIQSYKK